jgi:hypothetical protein
MRTEPCKQCGNFDFYVKGNFSYCRPCHSEAQKRYIKRKAQAEEVSLLKPPSRLLHEHSFNNARRRLACKNGHPINSENVRVSSQRDGKHLFRRCRACARNEKRVKYGLEAEPTPARLSELLDQQDKP